MIIGSATEDDETNRKINTFYTVTIICHKLKFSNLRIFFVRDKEETRLIRCAVRLRNEEDYAYVILNNIVRKSAGSMKNLKTIFFLKKNNLFGKHDNKQEEVFQ